MPAQAFDFSRLWIRCLISWQRLRLSKINDLETIRANPDGPQRSVYAIALQHDFWG